MNHEIPAFLKLNIDGYQAIGKAPSSRPHATHARVADSRAADLRAPGLRPAPKARHELTDQQLAASLSALALAGATVKPASDQALLSVWQSNWTGVEGKHDCVSLGAQLIAAYREPQRAFHGVSHLIECLRLWREWSSQAHKPDEIAIALWFHDAIYDTARHDSEARSARWALDALTAGGVPFDTVRRIRDLVIATRANESPSNNDARLMIDIDQAILGASAERYDRYEADLQTEHSHMPEFIYRRKRIETLKTMSTPQRLFQTDLARDTLEANARENIARTVARLQDRPIVSVNTAQ